MTSADIKKFLPANWLESTGKNIPAIIESINVTHKRLEDLVESCIAQLFTQTATGRYLIQLGEQEGFTMPANSGLDIRAYRSLVPLMVSNPKQVRLTIDELIQAFYTAERTKASIVSATPGPHSLNDGDDIIIESDSGITSVSIVTGQVSDLSNVTSAEIAAVINSSQSVIRADTVIDRATALEYLRLTSITSGVSSNIRVAGGKLQNVMKFPSLIATAATTGVTWNVTKDSAYTDVVRFTWDGIGANPMIYLAKKDDVLTIRGLADGLAPFSLLNGSYVLADVGYDYFDIRNTSFQTLSSLLVLSADNNLAFTSQAKIGLYDRDEFAFTNETGSQTITMTVPAIPPLGRRFLSGSAHLHGAVPPVLDFTRSTIKLSAAVAGDRPQADNHFLLQSRTQRIDARHPYYRTTGIDGNLSQPTYTLDTGDESLAILPYTANTSIGTNPIEASVDSDEYVINFPFRHGLERAWGITLSGCTGSANILAADLNKEHEVSRIIDKNSISIKLQDSLGVAVPYQGVAFAGTVNVFQYASPQASGADFYMQFVSPASAAVFTPGMTFRFDVSGGTDTVFYIGQALRYRILSVVSVSGNIVNFIAGIGAAPNGQVMSGVSGRRSSSIGGAASYRLDKTSPVNQDRVFDSLVAVMLGYTPSLNSQYVSSYIYDPTGDQYTVTVSKYIVETTQSVLRGDNPIALMVDSVTVDGEPFPQTGSLILDYGTSAFEGPIKYLAISENPGSNQILIDPAYRFKKAHAVGAKVQYIHSNQVFQPGQYGTEFPCYVTGTAQARNTMFALAELLVAAGIFVEQQVLLPGLRYDDPGIIPFE